MKINKFSELDLREKRYDAIFHLVTCADGAENHYNMNNVVRHETNLEAMLIDKKL
jgi:hypothetical protein